MFEVFDVQLVSQSAFVTFFRYDRLIRKAHYVGPSDSKLVKMIKWTYIVSAQNSADTQEKTKTKQQTSEGPLRGI